MTDKAQQTDLLAETTFARVIPIKPVKAKKLKDPDAPVFQPVVLAHAPETIQAMPEGDVDEKIAKAIAVLMWALERYEICFSFSGGKDSSTVLSLGLAAAVRLLQEGRTVKRFAVLNSDTLVENPEVLAVTRGELAKIQQWIARHGLPGEVHVTQPALNSQFAVSIIGGKSIISTPATNRNCTTDMKSVPLSARRDQVFGKNDPARGKFAVGVTGVRYGESQERTANMTKRAESPVQVVQTDAKGSVFLAPIAYWSTDDVMEYIGLAVNNLLPVEIYSDFVEVWRIYKDAEGECTVGRGDKPSKGCSARHGCYICNMVASDKSMDGFLSQDRYAYMQPLAKFREFLSNTVFDLSTRTWVGRSITDGYIKFAPDAYAPWYLQDLLRYALTIDVEELENSRSLGIRPRFQIVSLEALFAIDAMWSLQGFALPFTAAKIYRDIVVEGQRFPVPASNVFPKVLIPAPRFIHVGTEWDDTAPDGFTGLRDPLLESMHGPCGETQTITAKGVARQILRVNTGDHFSVDPESAALILEFELDRLVDKYHAAERHVAIGGAALSVTAYKFYLTYGTLTLAKSQVGKIDQILRRTAWRERLGLAGYNYDHQAALLMSLEAIPPVSVEEAAAKAQAKAKEAAERVRWAKQDAVFRRALTLRDLHRHWSPKVDWRSLVRRNKDHKSMLPCRLVPAHCLNKATAYQQGRKAWALHHFVRLGELVRFLKANPAIAEQVKAHRCARHKRGHQMSLLAA